MLYICRVSEFGTSSQEIQCEEGQNFVRIVPNILYVSENHMYCLNAVSYVVCTCTVSELGMFSETNKYGEGQNLVRIVSDILFVSGNRIYF